MTDSPRVIVVGSGPIGAAYARLILDGNTRATVLMVELGPRISQTPGLNVRNIPDKAAQDAARLASQGPNSPGMLGGGGIPGGVPAVEGTFTARQGTHLVDDGGPLTGHSPGMPAAALATNVGGQGAHWTCACPPPADSELVDFIPAAEWDDLIGEAERLLHVEKDAFHSSVTQAITQALGAEFNSRLPQGKKVGPFPVAVTIRPDGKLEWTGTDTVLGPLLIDGTSQQKRFELRDRTQARRILLNNDVATGVLLRDLHTGREYEEHADVVIVAADAVRTPQLLFASGVRPAALGRYLTEHPVLLSTAALRPEVVERLYPDGVPDGGSFSTAAGDAVSAAIRIPFSDAGFPYSAQIMHTLKAPMPIPDDHPLANSPYGYVNVGFGIRKYPRVEDGLTFSETESDAFDMPNVTIDYALTQREEKEIAAARLDQTRALEILGTVVPGGQPRLAPNGSSLHYQGTFRSGATDDGTSVVDPWSRVWGIQNLVLGGNGTIPTATVVNPTLFSTALAVRGARKLLEQFESAGAEDRTAPVSA
ncbi:choline dehydrogenase [Pseudarthrobacter sp. NamE2]|uniref:GMC oxidoreductase n=1 Tax=Pseudarthrobacter sp. NamE2 TaxID=2576838 RepID=UPI0010FD3025|nr:GMC oxidoreductase [Pseudarthrobacter sp. NamE2]TLM83593.1 choline dehydrogenase [Pseudarthrobacter sp. NamE2]